jgi:hypothetical protein
MNLFLAVGHFYVPTAIKKNKLRELFDVTADAFQHETPLLEGYSFDQCLRQYALFTKDQAEESLRRGNNLEIKPRLYQGAYALAQRLKKSFSIDRKEDALTMAKIVYKILKIDFKCDQNGAVLIRRCFFSSFYSSQVCRVLSSLDEGLLEGLSGGSFRFSQRITDGMESCRAHLSFERSSM